MICTVRPGAVTNHTGVKLLPLALILAPATAASDPGWRIDVSARGIASVELGDSSTQMRDVIVPTVGARIERRVGSVYVGGAFGAGLPAWYGKTEATLSIDHERVFAKPTCEVVSNDFIAQLVLLDSPA